MRQISLLELLREVQIRITRAAGSPPDPFDNELLNEIAKAILKLERDLYVP